MTHDYHTLATKLSAGPGFVANSSQVEELMLGLLKGVGIHRLGLARSTTEVLESATVGYDKKELIEYNKYYRFLSPRIKNIEEKKPVMTDAALLEDEQFRKSEFYDWNFRVCGACDIVAFHIPTDDDRYSVISVGRDRKHGTCTDEDVRTANLLAPLIQNNLTAMRSLNEPMPFVECALDYLDSDKLFAVVDENACVIMSSRRFRELPLIEIPENRRISIHGYTEEFTRSFTNARATNSTSSMRIPSAPLGRLTISPIEIKRFVGSMRAFVISIEMNDLEHEHLTSAEKQVARLLRNGLSLREISQRRNVSYNTIRNQVSAIHSKLGTHHIGELLAKVTSL